MPISKLSTYWETTDGETVKLYRGDVLQVLKKLPSQSVQCVVTSPPYFGLRDYGTGSWEGGDPECDHAQTKGSTRGGLHSTITGGQDLTPYKSQYLSQCKMCGARRTDHQLGSESSPDCGQLIEVEPGLYRKGNCAESDWASGCYVCRMVLVFRELRRVLRDDGTFFLNYGDSYSNGGAVKRDGGHGFVDGGKVKLSAAEGMLVQKRSDMKGISAGNLVGIPWRVALALQADGWVLRQDIILSKKSPMPESVRNRCTKSHEYLFLLTKKGSGYYCDMEAIREPLGQSNEDYLRMLKSKQRQNSSQLGSSKEAGAGRKKDGFNSFISDGKTEIQVPSGRNKRSVWWIEEERVFLDWVAENSPEVLNEFVRQSFNKLDTFHLAPEAYPGAHFATFSSKLITPPIKAGTSEYGCCADCGTPWKRVVEEKKLVRYRLNDYVKRKGKEGTGNSCANSVAGVDVKTVGWEPGCECYGKFVKGEVVVDRAVGDVPMGWAVGSDDHTAVGHNTVDGREKVGEVTEKIQQMIVEYVSDLELSDHPVVPCVVLDPFVGSGTVNAVSIKLGRDSIGIDLSKEYLDNNAIPRIEGVLFSRPGMSDLVARESSGLVFGEEIGNNE